MKFGNDIDALAKAVLEQADFDMNLAVSEADVAALSQDISEVIIARIGFLLQRRMQELTGWQSTTPKTP